jgi:hypothetical protein
MQAPPTLLFRIATALALGQQRPVTENDAAPDRSTRGRREPALGGSGTRKARDRNPGDHRPGASIPR